MDNTKRQKIEAAGYRVMTVQEFLDLTPAEAASIDMKIALVDALKARRQELGLTQRECAERLGIKQPQLARMEVGAQRSVTMDAIMDALLELGVSRQTVGAIVAGEAEPPLSVKPLAITPGVKMPRRERMRRVNNKVKQAA